MTLPAFGIFELQRRKILAGAASASRPEVFGQAVLSIFCLATNGDPRRSRALRYFASSYGIPVCQQR
jgi:hypothetical protein